MKIAIFTDSFVPGIGGTENAVVRYATELAKTNEVLVLAPNYHQEFDDNKFDFKVARAKSLQVTANDFWAMPGISKKMKRTLKEFAPDVVHTQSLGMMAGFGNKYAKKHNIPSVCTVHTKFRYCYKNALKSSFLAEILLKFVMRRAKKADRVCSVSYSMIDELKSYGLKKEVTIVKNGIAKAKQIEHTTSESEKFALLFVGLIIEYKNIGFSLKCLAELKKIRSDFVFTIVGRGPHLKKFQKLAAKLNLTDNVVFTGAITDRTKLNSLYASTDLFLFTSVFDNDSLVILEAAGASTPSLVLEGTGSAERITDNVNGFVVENDPVSVANKINELMNNRQHLREVGLKAAEIGSTWQETAERYLPIYQEEIAKKLNK